MKDAPRVLGLGGAELNIIGVVPSLHAARETELDSISLQVGGVAAVAVGTVVSMGCRARFACKVADELAGSFVLHALRDAGVETRSAVAADRNLSGIRFTLLGRGLDDRASYYSRGDVDRIDEGDFDYDKLLEDVNAVIIDGRLPEPQVRLASLAKKRGIVVIFDGGSFGSQVGELVALADIVVASERLAAELSHTDNLERSLVELQRMGPRAAIITLGENGAIGLHGDQLVQQPAFDVDVIDSEAAGSVFCGAFTASLLSELSFPRCIEFACAAAALSCRDAGPWAGMPTREETVQLIRHSAG